MDGGSDDADASDRVGDPPAVDPTDEHRVETAPEDAFGLVANETRVGILEALWDAGEPRTFSQLREAVGVADSGQFNYHLDRLVGRFVRKVDPDADPDHPADGEQWPDANGDGADEGYVLTYAGQRVVAAIVSGTFTESATVEPIPVGDCYECDGRLTARYASETVTIACQDCGAPLTRYEAPPNLVRGYDREELPAALSRWAMTKLRTADQGFCSFCAGRTRPSPRDPGAGPDVPMVEYECEACGATVSAAVSAMVLSHPEVVAFHADRGIDLTETPPWELQWLFEESAAVVSGDPYRARVTPRVDGDEMHVTVDEEMRVVDVERPD